jgi:uncharacterized protein YegP (UPF0339 family)
MDPLQWIQTLREEVISLSKFVIYQDRAGKYRWRLIAGNGEKVASSGEAFVSRFNAARATRDVKRNAANATTP